MLNILSASWSGISIANSSSIAMTTSTMSKLSKPKSSANFVVAVTFDGSTWSKFLTTDKIRSETSEGSKNAYWIQNNIINQQENPIQIKASKKRWWNCKLTGGAEKCLIAYTFGGTPRNALKAIVRELARTATREAAMQRDENMLLRVLLRRRKHGKRSKKGIRMRKMMELVSWYIQGLEKKKQSSLSTK